MGRERVGGERQRERQQERERERENERGSDSEEESRQRRGEADADATCALPVGKGWFTENRQGRRHSEMRVACGAGR